MKIPTCKQIYVEKNDGSKTPARILPVCPLLQLPPGPPSSWLLRSPFDSKVLSCPPMKVPPWYRVRPRLGTQPPTHNAQTRRLSRASPTSTGTCRESKRAASRAHMAKVPSSQQKREDRQRRRLGLGSTRRSSPPPRCPRRRCPGPCCSLHFFLFLYFSSSSSTHRVLIEKGRWRLFKNFIRPLLYTQN